MTRTPGGRSARSGISSRDRSPSSRAIGRTDTRAGVLLVVIGAAFLVVQVVDLDLGGVGWPFFVIVPGVALLVLGLVGTSGLIYAGAVVTTVGSLLLFQSSTRLWATWSYAWALIPLAVGVAQMLQGARSGSAALARAGLRSATGGLVLFALGAAFFEGILHVSGGVPGAFATILAPALLIVAGVALLVNRAVGSRSRA